MSLTKQERRKEWLKTNAGKVKAYAKKSHQLHREERLQKSRDYKIRLKIELLSHYGLDGQAKCCWPECGITDMDMLTLDHIHDNGAEHRKQLSSSSHTMYNFIKKHNFPPDFQTLCHNHQWKKEMIRRRRDVGIS
jgi:hypothetical protein